MLQSVNKIFVIDSIYRLFVNYRTDTAKLAKLRSFIKDHFVLSILFVITLASDRVALYGINKTWSLQALFVTESLAPARDLKFNYHNAL